VNILQWLGYVGVPQTVGSLVNDEFVKHLADVFESGLLVGLFDESLPYSRPVVIVVEIVVHEFSSSRNLSIDAVGASLVISSLLQLRSCYLYLVHLFPNVEVPLRTEILFT